MKSSNVLVKIADSDFEDIESEVILTAKKIIELLELANVELSVVICSDAFIQKLNLKYRGIDSPTDVLSFYFDSEMSLISEDKKIKGAIPRMLGDVVISAQTAERQSETGLLMPEITRLLVHGILHLSGHEHDIPRREKKNERCCRQNFKKIAF